jgi:ArsR family transcriptional regulator, arsenate/arsenite/antimonite-responsive transcriptional repressor / arsenate reductase (thioredoxin)
VRGRNGAPLATVLFLCTGNSARSQMAEALCERLSDGAVGAVSAGSHPKALHANAVSVMRDRGIDLSGRRSKHLSEFAGRRFDYVISLCDRVREVCPEFPGAPELIHWSIPDPAREPGPDEATRPAFERTAAELETRIGFLIKAIYATPQEVSERA